MNSNDVVIIGAGAAGATAAFHLAKEGFKVQMVDKSSGFVLKPCAGGMASSVQQFFPFSLDPIVDEIIKEVNFTWRLSDLVIAELPGESPFWIVKREKLDEYISTQALEQGAKLITSFEVKEIYRTKNIWSIRSSDDREIHAKCIVVADGSGSNWAKKFNLGPKNLHYASTTSVRLEGKGFLKKELQYLILA